MKPVQAGLDQLVSKVGWFAPQWKSFPRPMVFYFLANFTHCAIEIYSIKCRPDSLIFRFSSNNNAMNDRNILVSCDDRKPFIMHVNIWYACSLVGKFSGKSENISWLGKTYCWKNVRKGLSHFPHIFPTLKNVRKGLSHFPHIFPTFSSFRLSKSHVMYFHA